MRIDIHTSERPKSGNKTEQGSFSHMVLNELPNEQNLSVQIDGVRDYIRSAVEILFKRTVNNFHEKTKLFFQI